MKKLFCLLFITLFITGCGQSTELSQNVENIGNDVEISPDETLEHEVSEENNADTTYVLTFEASTIDGNTLTSECFSQSKLTMINVWATYCGPCIEEMPSLGEIADSYDSADFQIIGIISDVDTNAKEETLKYAEELITQTGADYPHLLLNDSLYNNLLNSVSAVPTSFFVNQEGEVLGYLIGSYSKEDWEQIIQSLLEKNEL